MRIWMLKQIFLLTAFLFLPFSASKAQTAGAISVRSVNAPQTFQISPHPVLAPTSVFFDENGKETSLRDFKGKILLVNIWTTSCAQCVIELPMLDRLQKDMGGIKFQVIALSSDLEPFPVLRRFWVNRGLKNLKIFADPQARFSQAADVKGLPTTFLIDENGREVGRIRGIAEWDGPRIKAQIRDLIRAAKEKARKKQEEEQRKVQENTQNQTDSTESFPPSLQQTKKEIQNWFKK